jgi:omega-6 fatty acid desaturase (delta-12 desaturase)
MFEPQAIDVAGLCDSSPGESFSPSWRKRLGPYCKPDAHRAVRQLLITSIPFLASMIGLLYGLAHGRWYTLALVLPAAIFLVRLFVIQHDCGHGSFFKSRHANEGLGLVLSILTLMPYWSWRRAHAVHHATSGNLGRRGTGDVTTLTVREYLSRSAWKRFVYRVYRHPIVFFGIGPIYFVLIRYRIPMSNPLRDWQHWSSIVFTNAIAAAGGAVLAIIIGPCAFLLAWSMVVLLATAVGVWFFYIQHQFADTYWADSASWEFHRAAISGSSFYDLPRVLDWLTGSIGFHHIHHLACKIPNYRLRACFSENPEFQCAKRVTLWASLKSVRLALWDEDLSKLVSFRQICSSSG